MPGLTIRTRLTLWYGAIVALTLTVMALVVSQLFARNLLAEIDRALDEELAELEKEVTGSANRASIINQLQSAFADHPFYEIQVLALPNDVVFSTSALSQPHLPPPDMVSVHETQRQSITGGRANRKLRLASRAVTAPAGVFIIQAADSEELYERGLHELVVAWSAIAPFALGGALVSGWWMAKRALAPIDRMSQVAHEITASELNRRIPIDNAQDELGRLAAVFNAMFCRLESAFDELRQFTADAAHELRTPLAAMRCEAEVALRTSPPAHEYRQILEGQIEEIDRLTALAEQLLTLCREDQRLQPLQPTAARLDSLLEELMEGLAPVAESRGVVMRRLAMTSRMVHCDEPRIRRALFNVLDNAIKYTPRGGTVVVRSEDTAEGIRMTIEDTGIGIPPEHVPHVFQRFYRVDPARHEGGTGLGLAIARALIESHQGTIDLASQPGRGTTVTIQLPEVPRPNEGERSAIFRNSTGPVPVERMTLAAAGVAGSWWSQTGRSSKTCCARSSAIGTRLA